MAACIVLILRVYESIILNYFRACAIPSAMGPVASWAFWDEVGCYFVEFNVVGAHLGMVLSGADSAFGI